MLTHCPACRQPLQLTDDQTARLQQALAQLAPTKPLAMKCPTCRMVMYLDKSGQALPAPAPRVQPPPPPNLDWLQSGLYQGEDKVEDVPMALLLHEPGEQRRQIGEALETVGYQVVMVTEVAEAIERMRFVHFSCVAFQADMEGSLAQSNFHTHMRNLAMERRRYLFYILISPTLHTLYDLEALASSANLTVNTSDLAHFDIVLRKSIPAYEELFGPLLEELGAYGKR